MRPDRFPGLAGTRITILRSFAEAEPLWKEAQQHCACSGFQTFEWLSTWQETIGAAERVQPRIVHLADPEGRTLMLLPLGIRRRRGLLILGFLGDVVSDCHAPLIRPDFARRLDAGGPGAVLALLTELSPKVDLIAFDKMPAHIGNAPNPFVRLPGASHEWNAYAAHLPASFDAYRKRHSAPFFGDTLRRLRRLTEEVAEPVLYRADSAESAAEIFGTLLRQKAQRGHTVIARPACLAFYRMMTERHLGSGLITLSALMVGDAIVATHWGMIFRKRFYYLQPANEFGRWVRYSAGRLLLLRLVQDGIERGLKTFDLTIGDETYKRFWADQIIPLYAFRRAQSLKGRLHLALRRLVRGAETLARRVRKLPPKTTPLSLGG